MCHGPRVEGYGIGSVSTLTLKVGGEGGPQRAPLFGVVGAILDEGAVAVELASDGEVGRWIDVHHGGEHVG